MEVFQSVIKHFISEKELNKLLVTDRKGGYQCYDEYATWRFEKSG